ncbi:MBL fold metallo-hydrolase [Thalassobacillus hwangdonensis]
MIPIMTLQSINEHCYYYSTAVNVGYVHVGNTGMIIDAGIDDSSIKKVVRELETRKLPITHLFITHAHADHYGGAAYLQKKFGVETIAPQFERAILNNPGLEPLYLFGGNDPLPELHNKFLEGKPIEVHHEITEGSYMFGEIELQAYLVPGHSYHQLALNLYGCLFAADAYFSEEQLEKHKIPYITDAEAAIQSLIKLREIPCDGAVPGHGEYEQQFLVTVEKNIDYHEKVLEELFQLIKAYPEGISHESIVEQLCGIYKVTTTKLAPWLLYRTAVTAYIIGLIKREKIVHRIENNKWMFIERKGEA